jgi:hypothetical protein
MFWISCAPSRESLGGEALRKVSLVVASVAALLCFAAVALAQQNVYGVTGKIASGGTKKKPKPVGVIFNYTVGEASGNLSSPVRTYKIHFDGLKFDTSAAKAKCSASKINAVAPIPSDKGCPKGSLVGTGSVKALVGTAGQPTNPDSKCNLKLNIYAGSSKSLTLFLYGQLPECIAQIGQAIDAKLSTDATGGSLTFTVPDSLLHPVQGIDVGVTSVQSTIKKVVKGKKGLFMSTGCKGTRKVTVTFTAENGQTESASNSAGKC